MSDETKDAGWYPDPNTGDLRYWNGVAWLNIPAPSGPILPHEEATYVSKLQIDNRAHVTSIEPSHKEPADATDKRIQRQRSTVKRQILIAGSTLVLVVAMATAYGVIRSPKRNACEEGIADLRAAVNDLDDAPFGSTKTSQESAAANKLLNQCRNYLQGHPDKASQYQKDIADLTNQMVKKEGGL